MRPLSRPVDVALVVDASAGPGTRHGLAVLRRALQERSLSFREGETEARYRIVVGKRESPLVRAFVSTDDVPAHPEGVFIRRLGDGTLVVAGGGDRGAMYGLLEVAEAIRDASPDDPFRDVLDASETPDVPERAVSIYTMHRRHFESRFFSPEYWERYLDQLARCRFSTFVLLFAYESSGYFAPPYPYFFSLPEFPEVRVIGMSERDQQEHLNALNRLIEQTHAHGLDFTFGIWDHIYRGGVQRGPGDGEEWRVVGVTEKNLVAYNTAGLRELLRRVPHLDALQFRMHNESGLKNEEMLTFWSAIYDVMLEAGRGIRFDARAKELPDTLIDLALQKGLPLRICTKYWMEQMGLPFHPTHIHPNNQRDRRHGYADLLRYPQRYKMHWRLWNGGTSRLLLWGDPDYVRRFAESTHLYDGEGFEVNEPLATKMAGQPHSQEPFAIFNAPYRFSSYEFERYWYFFETFGRVAYNPALPAEHLLRGFRRRFGDVAEQVQRVVHLASRVLPRLVATHYPYHLFPTTRGWVEKQRMGSLPRYADGDPSDTALFLSPKEAARCLVEGRESAKRHPLDSSAWFERLHREILDAVAQVGPASDPELVTTLADARILAHLALFHARRLKAAFAWNLYRLTDDLFAFDDALAHEREAISAWEGLVASAGDIYADDLMFGVRSAGLSGHWRDELDALRTDYADLERQREAALKRPAESACRIAHVPARRAAPNTEIAIRATIRCAEPIASVSLLVRTTGFEGRYPLNAVAPSQYVGGIPRSLCRTDFAYRIEVESASGWKGTFPDGSQEERIAVTVTDDTEAPRVVHTPLREAEAGQPLSVRAQVSDPSGVRWVRLLYRRVTQFDDYRVLEMTLDANGEYVATVEGEHLDPQYDFMYRIEAMDAVGNGCLYPDFERETPYIIVRLNRNRA